MPFRLILPDEVYREIVKHAYVTRPAECCGLLAGVVLQGRGEVLRGYPLGNGAKRHDEFESDPRSMFEAVRDIDRNGWEILAVYHSHPTTPPVPSRKDLERNYAEEVMNLIVSLAREPAEVRGWWLTATNYSEAEWEVKG